MSKQVLLIHGLGGSRLDMWPLARRLKKRGWSVQNWGYRSLGRRIEDHAERLGDRLLELVHDQSNGPLHLVTHSMGGIIARLALHQSPEVPIGKIIMLAPPHRGSHTARKLEPWLGWLTPSLGQLSDAPNSFVNQLPNPFSAGPYDLAIIEAGRDRVIQPEAVDLPGRREYTVVDGHHGTLTWYRDTGRLVENYLENGQFELSAASDSQPPETNRCPHPEV